LGLLVLDTYPPVVEVAAAPIFMVMAEPLMVPASSPDASVNC